MLTYGLVKQRGPYARDYPQSYQQDNREVISPRYPFSAADADANAYHNRSLWAARLVPDSANLENPQFKMDVLKERQKEMQLRVNLSLLFGNSFGVEDAESGEAPSGMPEEPQGEEGEPIKEEVGNKEDEVIEPGEDFYPISPEELAPIVEEATNAVASVFDRFQITADQIRPYMSRMLPVVSHFINTGVLAVEGGIELLLGPTAARYLIRAIREDERLRRAFTTALSDYAIRPAARFIGGQVREFLYDPTNYVQILFGGQERGLPPPALPITFPDGSPAPLPPGPGMFDDAADTGGAMALDTVSQNAPTIIRLLLNYLAGPGANPTDITRLANTFAGPVSIINGRQLRLRGPDGRVVNLQQMLRRAFGRRTNLR